MAERGTSDACGAGAKEKPAQRSLYFARTRFGLGAGQATDIEITAKQIMHMKGKLNKILSVSTGQPIKKVESDTDRDFYLTPQEAVKYGLIDEVIGAKQ